MSWYNPATWFGDAYNYVCNCHYPELFKWTIDSQNELYILIIISIILGYWLRGKIKR